MRFQKTMAEDLPSVESPTTTPQSSVHSPEVASVTSDVNADIVEETTPSAVNESVDDTSKVEAEEANEGVREEKISPGKAQTITNTHSFLIRDILADVKNQRVINNVVPKELDLSRNASEDTHSSETQLTAFRSNLKNDHFIDSELERSRIFSRGIKRSSTDMSESDNEDYHVTEDCDSGNNKYSNKTNNLNKKLIYIYIYRPNISLYMQY